MKAVNARAALVLRGESVTVVTAKTSAHGQLSDLKALIKAARASGPAMLLTPGIVRSTEGFPGELSSLPSLIHTRQLRDALPYAALVYTNASGKVALFETTEAGLVPQFQHLLRGTPLSLAGVMGTLEAATRFTQASCIVADRHAQGGAWGVNDPSLSLITSLKATNTLDEIVKGGLDALPMNDDVPTIILSGGYSDADAQDATRITGQPTVRLSDEALGRLALQAAPPSGLGSLVLTPLSSGSSFNPKSLTAPLLLAAALGLGSAALAVITARTTAQTADLAQQDAALAPVLAQVRTLKAANDLLTANITTAETLSKTRGELSGDLLALTTRVADVQGAKLSNLRGPETPSDAPSYDGQRVLAAYTLSAHTDSRQAAETLISVLNQAPYAANTRSVNCKDTVCTLDLTVGLLGRPK